MPRYLRIAYGVYSQGGSRLVKRGNTLLMAGLMAGVIGPALFWIVVLVDGSTKPGYDARTQTISELALGEHGWAQGANFFVVGLLMVAFAVGLRVRFLVGKASTFGPLLIALFGLGLAVSGIFATDPPQGDPPAMTISGTIHDLAFLLVLAAIVAACFVFARRFRRERTWRGYSLYSIITGFLVPGLLVAFVLQGDGAPAAGLFQRVLVAVVFLWVEVIALRAVRLTARSR
jgi:hypothetical membrane protein